MDTSELRKIYLDRGNALVAYTLACTREDQEEKDKQMKIIEELDDKFCELLLKVEDLTYNYF